MTASTAPPPVRLGTWPAGSPEWHTARAGGLGGSEIAAVVGLSPWESRFSLWHRKAGEIGPAEVTAPMEWGTRLEPAILDKFAENHPDVTLARPAGTWCHPDRPWQIANPDAIIDGAVVDAKCSRFGDGWGAGPGDVPVHIRCQMLWYCDVLGLPRAHVALLVGGHDYREYVIDADPGEATLLVEAGEAFLASVAGDRRPDVDSHTATYTTIRALHPDIDGTDHDLHGGLAERFIRAKAALTEAKAAAQHATSLVADAMGSARRARWDGSTIATRQCRGDGSPFLVAGRALPAIAPEEN